MFFGTGNPNLRSILKPEVELMVFLRMRSKKNVKNAKKRPQNTVLRPNFPRVYVFRHGKSKFEVHFETGSRINVVSAHAQYQNCEKTTKMSLQHSWKTRRTSQILVQCRYDSSKAHCNEKVIRTYIAVGRAICWRHHDVMISTSPWRGHGFAGKVCLH